MFLNKDQADVQGYFGWKKSSVVCTKHISQGVQYTVFGLESGYVGNLMDKKQEIGTR